tara:strand:- start:159 stop:656 length:498 start_codon:yes stop_codon:yes gene_type:complete
MISYLINDAKFWTAVAFILFVILTFKPVKSILLKSLDEKIQLIINRINDSKKIKEDSELLIKDIEDKEKNLENSIKSLKQDAEKTIINLVNESEKKIGYQINIKKKSAELKIKQLEQEAINEIKNKTTYHTIEIVKNIMKTKMSDSKHQDLIDSSIKDLDRMPKS